MDRSNSLACNLAGEVVRDFGSVRLRVFGASMAPTVHPGDVVSVERVSAREISPGEIVLFAREGRLIVHRVRTVAGDSFQPLVVTRGDRMRQNDAAVSSSELLGRVTRIERRGRNVRLANRLSPAQQVICGLLRISDRATYLYLRLCAL